MQRRSYPGIRLEELKKTLGHNNPHPSKQESDALFMYAYQPAS
jgi:hypothetical protein